MKILLKNLILKNKLLAEDEIIKYIKAGKVYVNDVVNYYPNDSVYENSKIKIKDKKKWVSRGGYKLLHALKEFNISVNDKICIDIGSSTGGFTDVLLSKKAKLVYCVDSGYNQLDYKLRIDDRTIVMEKTNLKSLTKDTFDNIIDLIVCDVSFISLEHVFNVSKNIIKKDKRIIVLIKPEFEANSSLIITGGYVEEKHHEDIIKRVEKYANSNSFKKIEIIKSPILGKKSKNIEYLGVFLHI